MKKIIIKRERNLDPVTAYLARKLTDSKGTVKFRHRICASDSNPEKTVSNTGDVYQSSLVVWPLY